MNRNSSILALAAIALVLVCIISMFIFPELSTLDVQTLVYLFIAVAVCGAIASTIAIVSTVQTASRQKN